MDEFEGNMWHVQIQSVIHVWSILIFAFSSVAPMINRISHFSGFSNKYKAFLAWNFKCHNDNKWGKERKQSLRYFNFPFFSWQTSTWKSAKKLKRRLRFITAEEETDKIEMFPTCVTQKNETFRAVEIAERRFGTKNNSRLEVGASRSRRLATLHQGLPDYDDAGRRDVSWTKDSLPSSVERDDPNDGVTALRSSARVLIAKSPS